MSNDYHPSVMNFFPTPPLPGPRGSQEVVIKEVEKAFREGARIVLLEAPVGSGKTAIAVTLSQFYGESHILTPRKSLQDQYYADFHDYLVLMKGRSAYPCIRWDTSKQVQVYRDIESGRVDPPESKRDSCAAGICINNSKRKEECEEKVGVCPYRFAIQVAQKEKMICHNLHSFIFQANFGAAFEKRKFLAIDEAHDAAAILRDFATKEFNLRTKVERGDHPNMESSVEIWQDWLKEDRFLPRTTVDREEYTASVDSLNSMGNKEYIVDLIEEWDGRQKIKFTPKTIRGMAENLIFKYADKILLMSGTVYNKAVFCNNLGINPEDVHFIRMGSTFPAKLRPVYVKPEYMVDTSHRMWEENFPKMIEKIKKVMSVFHDKKGLIHAPSYRAAQEILEALDDDRVMTHSSESFQTVLDQFYAMDGNQVLISPVCQQGVDFKEDRARFQIVTRIPYLNTSDAFVGFKVENDFPWYNYQALVTFGQMLGRVNRSEKDFGVTILLDARFTKFIMKNKSLLPKWQMDAMVFN